MVVVGVLIASEGGDVRSRPRPCRFTVSSEITGVTRRVGRFSYRIVSAVPQPLRHEKPLPVTCAHQATKGSTNPHTQPQHRSPYDISPAQKTWTIRRRQGTPFRWIHCCKHIPHTRRVHFESRPHDEAEKVRKSRYARQIRIVIEFKNTCIPSSFSHLPLSSEHFVRQLLQVILSTSIAQRLPSTTLPWWTR